MKLILIIVVQLFLVQKAFTQCNTDSLSSILKNDANPLEIRLKAIQDMIYDCYLFSDPDSAYILIQEYTEMTKGNNEYEHLFENNNFLGIYYALKSQNEMAIASFRRGEQLARENEQIYDIASSLNNIGNVFDQESNYDSAMYYYELALEFYIKDNDFEGVGTALNNLSNIITSKGDMKKGLEYLFRSLKYSQKEDDAYGECIAMINIGLLYYQMQDSNLAVEYLEKGRVLSKKINSSRSCFDANTGLGAVYSDLYNDADSALFFYNEALMLAVTMNSPMNRGSALSNLGSVSLDLGRLNEAKKYLIEGREVLEEVGDYEGMVSVNLYLSELEEKNGNLQQSLKYAEEAFVIADDIGSAHHIVDASKTLYTLYKRKGKWQLALKYFELHNLMEDSVGNEEAHKEVIRQEYQFQYEKKAAADSVKNAEEQKVQDALLMAEKAENKQRQLEISQQRQQAYFLYGGLGLALLFGAFIFNRFKITNKQKGIIIKQKDQVGRAFEELEEKNQEILDSIAYAKRIQSAILPPDKLVKEYLENSFILYKPKDIVAGDFYWMETSINSVSNQKVILFAAADCTGHGVPGAMVSVVCNNGLNRSVREHGLTDPGRILDKTREIVIQEFEKSEEEVKDGMDIALCSLELVVPGSELRTQNSKSGTAAKLQYAGAHNPLWIIRNGANEVEEIKANKQPIGKFDNPAPYTTHTIELKKGDTLYIFSDGYADQFGGERGKKFKSTNFKTLLLSIQHESMEQQRILIDEAFEEWRGSLEQIDDICVIGVRV